MAFKDKLRTAFIPVAMAAASLIASPAHALTADKNGCMSLAEFNTQLAAEGQSSVVFGNHVIPETPTSPARSSFMIFTALKNGKVGKGYSFVADTPLGVTPTKMCVAGEFNNARGISNAALPDGIDPNSNLAKAINFTITDKGFNPMFYGEKNGAYTVVVGNPNKPLLNGMILIGNNDPTRQAGDQGGLIGLDYSPNYDRSVAISEPK